MTKAKKMRKQLVHCCLEILHLALMPMIHCDAAPDMDGMLRALQHCGYFCGSDTCIRRYKSDRRHELSCQCGFLL